MITFFEIIGMILTGIFIIGVIEFIFAVVEDFLECRAARNKIKRGD